MATIDPGNVGGGPSETFSPLSNTPDDTVPETTSPPGGKATTPARTPRTSIAASEIDQIGMPRAKLAVLSIGSSTHEMPEDPSIEVPSSASIPSDGRSARSRSRTTRSLARSASVTTSASDALVLMWRSSAPKRPRKTSAAASTARTPSNRRVSANWTRSLIVIARIPRLGPPRVTHARPNGPRPRRHDSADVEYGRSSWVASRRN